MLSALLSLALALPAPAADGLDELRTEYDAALAAWQTQFDAAEELSARAALRKVHPVHAYWDRFRSLADGGEGRAYLWLLDNTKSHISRRERGPARKEIYDRLLEAHAGADWIDEAVRRIPLDANDLGEDAAVALLETAGEKAGTPTTRAYAALGLARVLAGSVDKERRQRGKELLARYDKENVSVDASAIDFSASTIDGHDFRLSDYRGKVVLIDFYGFW